MRGSGLARRIGGVLVARTLRAARGFVAGTCTPSISSPGDRAGGHLGRPGKPAPRTATLTARETEIVALIRLGFRSGEIAAQAGHVINTVRNQIWRLMARLGVGTRAELIAACAPGDAK